MNLNLRIPGSRHAIPFQLLACVVLLLVGICGMMALAGLKEAPAEIRHQEASINVQTITATPEDVQTHIIGYGEVRPRDVVSITPEVSGRADHVHSRLEPGEIIAKGDILFEIDPRNYQAACKQARAKVEQCKNAIAQLKISHAADLERLKMLERNRELAGLQLERMQKLFEMHGVAAQSQVESAEQALNAIADLVEQLAQAVELFPVRIKDAKDGLASAEAAMLIAEANLERCTVRAPFDARIKDVAVEAGQYVNPGQEAVTLADDSVLEIHVPLDSRDAQKWLPFEHDRSREKIPWFNNLETVPCKIRWTEAPEDHIWEGRLHRVVRFDQQTRTLTVAVRLASNGQVSDDPQAFPLVEGMFCSVEIPGKILKGIYRLPDWAVSYEDTVYIAKNGRLKTVPVSIARRQGGTAIVTEGLEEGMTVIITRLVDPLENSLLKTTKAEWGSAPVGDEI